MIELVVFFLFSSIVLYTVFGGADFGAGVVELLVRREDERDIIRKILKKYMGPVWEANHIWLIVVIVILFNGFPKIYSWVSQVYHIPLVVLLIAIVLRGCMFVFIHYDVYRDKSHVPYSKIFSYSSIAAPICFGIIIGSISGGYMNTPDPKLGFAANFITPWWNLFSFVCGILVLCLFSYLACVFVLAKAVAYKRAHPAEPAAGGLVRRLKALCMYTLSASVLGGGLTFILGLATPAGFSSLFWTSWAGITGLALATFGLYALWWYFDSRRYELARVAAAFQVGIIVAAWWLALYPGLIRQGTLPLTAGELANTTGIQVLAYTLSAGLVLFVPPLIYLVYIFDKDEPAATT